MLVLALIRACITSYRDKIIMSYLYNYDVKQLYYITFLTKYKGCRSWTRNDGSEDRCVTFTPTPRLFLYKLHYMCTYLLADYIVVCGFWIHICQELQKQFFALYGSVKARYFADFCNRFVVFGHRLEEFVVATADLVYDAIIALDDGFFQENTFFLERECDGIKDFLIFDICTKERNMDLDIMQRTFSHIKLTIEKCEHKEEWYGCVYVGIVKTDAALCFFGELYDDAFFCLVCGDIES